MNAVIDQSPVAAPIRKQVLLPVSVERAFRLFTGRMTDWWFPGQGIGASPFESIELEGRPNGRWFERSAEGVETPWGDVVEWDPPARIRLAWRIGADWRFRPDLETLVDVVFSAEGASATRVTVEHAGLERLGSDGAAMAAAMDGGWSALLDRLAALAQSDSA